MKLILRKLKIFTLIYITSINFNSFSHAHMRGTFSNKEEALKKALEIGCQEIHKNKDKWLPCNNEKELHNHLR